MAIIIVNRKLATEKTTEELIKYTALSGKLLMSNGGDAYGESIFGNRKDCLVKNEELIFWTSPDVKVVARSKKNKVYSFGYNAMCSDLFGAKKYSGNIVWEMTKDGHNFFDFEYEKVVDENDRT